MRRAVLGAVLLAGCVSTPGPASERYVVLSVDEPRSVPPRYLFHLPVVAFVDCGGEGPAFKSNIRIVEWVRRNTIAMLRETVVDAFAAESVPEKGAALAGKILDCRISRDPGSVHCRLWIRWVMYRDGEPAHKLDSIEERVSADRANSLEGVLQGLLRSVLSRAIATLVPLVMELACVRDIAHPLHMLEICQVLGLQCPASLGAGDGSAGLHRRLCRIGSSPR
jgi:hypothetical protein